MKKTSRKISTKPRVNAAWHERHPLQKSPNLQQRLAWHVQHEKQCGCRPMPAKLRAVLEKDSKLGAARPARATGRRFAAFLRGVSPMNAKMSELKRCLESAGFREVKTVLASGNVTFIASEKDRSKLEARLEAAMQKGLGRTFQTIVRSIDELKFILASDPYAQFQLSSEEKRVITFLRKPARAQLELPITFEAAHILCSGKQEIYSTYVPGPRGPVFMNLIERTFGKEVTTRTWETLKKVVRAGETA